MKKESKDGRKQKSKKMWLGAALALLLTGYGTSFAAVGPRRDDGASRPSRTKLAADLRSLKAGGMIDVIVQFRQTPRSSHYSRMASRGATVKAKLHGIRAAAFHIPASALAALQNDPDVLYVSPDRPVHLTASNKDENFVSPTQDDIASSQYALDGSGVGVAVIDSGVSDHSDLHDASGTSRIVYSQSFVAGDTTTADAYGHGTHVAGIIAGNGASSGSGSGYSTKRVGIAPNANIINLRVLDQNGSGSDSQVIAGIQQAIALKNQYNIRVINLSLGRPVYESFTLDPLCQAVEQAWQAGNGVRV